MTMTQPSEAELRALTPKRGLSTVTRSFAVTGVEVRAKDEESTVKDFYGHATVYEKGYEMYGGPDKGGWEEFVDAGAGKKTLSESPDVAFLVNHTGLTLARTKAGTLQLAEDKIGLEVKAQLDTRVSIVNDLVLLMEAGNLDEMSFAFRLMKQKWLDADGEEVPWWDLSGIERHITEYSIHKGDVSVVNYGASPHTDASVRSLDAVVRDLTADVENIDEADLRRALDHLQALYAEVSEEPSEATKYEAEWLARAEAAKRAWLATHPI
jgi:HK97 family phage prohead protease